MQPSTAMPRRWKVLMAALVVGCTGDGGEARGPAPGSPAWYETASVESMASYFRAQCVAQGYLPGTREMADCIRAEASAAGQSNVARSAAIAAATAGN
jgi:hypothetical protein